MQAAVDAVIVGGGLAGLYSAYLLSQQGCTVVILEARDRLGGRIHGLALENGDTLDLGPSWFWPHQKHIAQLCRQFELTVFEQFTSGDALYQASLDSAIKRFAGAGTLTSYRIDGGVNQLVQALSRSMDDRFIHLNQPVHRVFRRNNLWEVETTTRTFQGKRLIIAAPPRVMLESSNIAEHLPAALQSALSSTPTWMAAQAKFVAHYATPFWRQTGLAGEAFSRVGPLVEMHDASAGDARSFGLFGFIGVSAQQRASIDQEALHQACLGQLGQVFGSQALNPIRSVIEDWSQQAFTCTDQDRLQAPQHPECNLADFSAFLSEQQLAFASTEVASHEAGYLEGALIAARAVVARC